MNIALIPPVTYAIFAFPLPRYGHLTSNIIESLNSAWKPIRSYSPLQLLLAI
jgi:hypothetical protein